MIGHLWPLPSTLWLRRGHLESCKRASLGCSESRSSASIEAPRRDVGRSDNATCGGATARFCAARLRADHWYRACRGRPPMGRSAVGSLPPASEEAAGPRRSVALRSRRSFGAGVSARVVSGGFDPACVGTACGGQGNVPHPSRPTMDIAQVQAVGVLFSQLNPAWAIATTRLFLSVWATPHRMHVEHRDFCPYGCSAPDSLVHFLHSMPLRFLVGIVHETSNARRWPGARAPGCCRSSAPSRFGIGDRARKAACCRGRCP